MYVWGKREIEMEKLEQNRMKEQQVGYLEL